jgi:hypothetical protein
VIEQWQREHAARGREPDVLGAADQQVVAVEEDVVLGQELTVDRAVDQSAHQVVGGLLHPSVHELDEVLHDLLVGRALRDGVGGPERHARQLEQLFAVLLGDPHEVADHVEGQPGRDVGDEVATARLDGSRDHRTDHPAHRVLQGADRPGGEPVSDHGAQLPVAWRIRQRKRPAAAGVLSMALGPQHDALFGTERPGVPADCPYVLVTGDRPEAGQGAGVVPVHRLMGPHPAPEGVRVSGGVQFGVDQHFRSGDCQGHRGLLGSRCADGRRSA